MANPTKSFNVVVRRIFVAALSIIPGMGARAQSTAEAPLPPDCSAPVSAAAASLDCATLARIDMAASQMVVSGYTPGVVVAITRGGRVVFARAYGQADVEAATPTTLGSVFPILSITKPFTAAAIMQLRDAGKLSLDDHLQRYFPTFPRGDRITLRHLLSHTSGIHDFLGDDRGPITSEALVALIAAQPTLFDFAPGEQYRYSNSNYVLLGRIVELVSGRPLRGYVRDSLVSKVPSLGIAVDQATDIVPNRASTYLRTTVPGRFANAPHVDPSVRFGAGSMRASIVDLAAWFDAFYAGRVIAPASVREMMTPAKLNDGRLTGGDWGAYGYGLENAYCNGHHYVGHGGGTVSGNTVAHYYLDDDFALYIIANTSHTAMQLEPRIIRQIFGPDKGTGTCN